MCGEHFDNIAYLQSGTERQREAYAVLMKYQVMEKLTPFDPILAGTIPINIDIDSSDLDIICCFENPQSFIDTVITHFGNAPCFKIREKASYPLTVVSKFTLDHFEIELFGQNVPTKEQPGYRHMIIEQHLLRTHGEAFRQQILTLKRQGYKTEPAFAVALGLDGDPYSALLDLDC